MEIIIDNERYICFEAKEFFEELEKNGYEWDGKMVVKKEQNKPKFKVGDIIWNKPTGVFMAIKEIKDDSYITTDGTMLLFKYQDKWELVGSKEEVVPQDKIPTSLEVNYAVNNIKSLGNKVSMLADEILALKQRVKALEIQVIKDMSTPPITKDPFLYPDKVTCDVFKTPDRAGDNVTLEDMKG